MRDERGPAGGRAVAASARRIVPLALVLVATLAAATSAAAAVTTGISDQQPAFFDSPPYRALALDPVRLIVPWDAGLRAGGEQDRGAGERRASAGHGARR